MKKLLFLSIVLTFGTISIMAQTPAPTTQTTAPVVKEANPADVASIDAIMKAVYDVISGDAGQKRDWDRFRSLFHKDAKLIPSRKNPQTGVTMARYLTPDDYATQSGPTLEQNGFHESEMTRHVDQFGNIAQVFSSYESFRKKTDKEPFMRGINSFQLLNDGKRWWVMNIFWQQESAESPIPKEYVKSKQ